MLISKIELCADRLRSALSRIQVKTTYSNNFLPSLLYSTQKLVLVDLLHLDCRIPSGTMRQYVHLLLPPPLPIFRLSAASSQD